MSICQLLRHSGTVKELSYHRKMYSIQCRSVIDLSWPTNLIYTCFMTVTPWAIYLSSVFINIEDALINYLSEGLFSSALQHFSCLCTLSSEAYPIRKTQGENMMLPPLNQPGLAVTTDPCNTLSKTTGEESVSMGLMWQCSGWKCERFHHSKKQWKVCRDLPLIYG